MLLHTVLFWLRPGLTHEEVAVFEAGLKTLMTISTVKMHFFGKPAPTHRPVVDSTYSYQLVLGFDDLQGHDQYQADPLHLAFLTAYSPLWAKVLVYDAE